MEKQQVVDIAEFTINSLRELTDLSKDALQERRQHLVTIYNQKLFTTEMNRKIAKEIGQINFIMRDRGKFLSDGTALTSIDSQIVDIILKSFEDVIVENETGQTRIREVIKYAWNLIELRERFMSYSHFEDIIQFICESTDLTDIRYYLPEEIDYKFVNGRIHFEDDVYDLMHKELNRIMQEFYAVKAPQNIIKHQEGGIK